MPNAAAERIHVLGPGAAQNGLWNPVAGEEATGVVRRRLPNSPEARQDVLAEARRILSQCIPPTAPGGRRTGLVMGSIQSGKTLSFTTLAAMANDNDFRIVIVIAGTTTDLAQQSRDRLCSDLGVEESPFTRWQHFHNPRRTEAELIRDVLAEWDDPHVSASERRKVLITVLKNHTRLENLSQVLAQLGRHVHVPTLIIDDEADQASLNNLVRQGEFSTTYSRIRQLQTTLPHHTFLQYTATPQANLLINLIDALSPETVVVLKPGPDYVGGSDIFRPDSPYVGIIPAHEIPSQNNPFADPPDSLQNAMLLFFVGVASGLHRRDLRPANRSMMVHPSRQIAGHRQYFNWIRAIRNLWIDILSGKIDEDSRQSLLDTFRRAHQELAATVAALEPFDQLAPRLLNALQRTKLIEINSQSKFRKIPWKTDYSWILVGGQVLDRGFTVEGLTVTYMPRGPGVGNADTIQQRARFLGYKGTYLGFCRVFLEQTVADAYAAYVTHEEDVQQRLINHAQSGRPLTEFRRVFVCDRALRPTRQSVLDIDIQRPTFPSGWYAPSRPPTTGASIETNRQLISDFFQKNAIEFLPDEGHRDRREIQRHLVARNVPLQAAYDELLSAYQVGSYEDDQKWIVALLLIDRYLAQHPEAACTIYRMSQDAERRRQVRNGEIINLFQGAYPTAGPVIYPGDRHIIGQDPVTVQIHTVTFTDGPAESGRVIVSGAPVITLWMRPEVRGDVVYQDQGGPPK